MVKAQPSTRKDFVLRQNRSSAALLGAAFVVLIVLPAALNAQSTRLLDDSRISFTPMAATGRANQARIELSTVTLTELTGLQSRQSNGFSTSVSMGRGVGLQLTPGGAPLRRMLRRELPRLFQYHLPPGTHPSDIRMRYELRSTRGYLDTLDNPELENSKVDVTLRPLSPVMLDSDIGGTTIQGGVILELSIDDVHASGRYQGSLTVLIDHL